MHLHKKNHRYGVEAKTEENIYRRGVEFAEAPVPCLTDRPLVRYECTQEGWARHRYVQKLNGG
jgi:hypothetical protein